MTAWLKSAPWAGWLSAALVASPLALLIAQVAIFSVNVPVLDDFDALLRFAEAYSQAADIVEKLSLLLANHIEHRPAVARLAALASLGVLGHIDFRLLNLMGALGLFLLALALWVAGRRSGSVTTQAIRFAPAVFFAFNPQYFQVFGWAMASIPNIWVTACAALALASLSRFSHRSFALAVLLSLFSLFSQGNGILVLPAGAVMLGLAGRMERLARWLLFAIPVSAAYMLSYQRPPGAAALSIADPAALLRYFLNFSGSAAGLREPVASLIAGVAMSLAGIAILLTGVTQRAPALIGMLLFLNGSAVLNALVRVGLGSESPLAQPRYTFYSSCMLAVTYLGLLEIATHHTARRFVIASFLGASIAFSLTSFARAGGAVRAQAIHAESELEHWWVSGDGGLLHPRPEVAEAALLSAIESGRWRIPQQLLLRAATVPSSGSPPVHPEPMTADLAFAIQADEFLVACGWSSVPLAAKRSTVLVLLGEAGVYELRVRPICCAETSTAGDAPRIPFRVVGSLASVDPGSYRIGVMERSHAREWLWLSDRVLDLE